MKREIQLCLAFVFLLTMLAAIGCGGGQSPEEVIRQYYSLSFNGEFEASYDMLSRPSKDLFPYDQAVAGWEDASGREDAMALFQESTFTCLGIEEGRAEVLESSPEVDSVWLLVSENGEWKIDLLGTYCSNEWSEPCWQNMCMVVTSSEAFAAINGGSYPGSIQEIIDAGLLDGPVSLYLCPEGGEITWNWNPGDEGSPPEPYCSIHGGI